MATVADINLDFDANLNDDAEGFGIEPAAIAHPPAVLSAGALPVSEASAVMSAPAPTPTNLEAAITLAMEVCSWEFTFFAWCDEYLYGAKKEALLDIPFVREVLRCARNYWGPRYFTKGSEEARERYYGIMAAQAALSAVERYNKGPLIQKILYYVDVAGNGGV